jgi:transcriptional regulator with XRE-family HTH domain
MSEINRIIRGRKLTKYRELRDLTKEDMATRLGVSPNTYGRYEKGEFEPKMDQWEKIADILNVPVEELLKTEPIVINMTNSHGPNVSGTNNHNFPTELLGKFTEQFEARFTALERSNERFMDMIEKLIKTKG